MKKLIILASASLMALGGVAFAQSEPNVIQGTPSSIFPFATANEIRIINGVPCRTVLIPGSGNVRVPVACAGQAGLGGTVPGEPLSTGSIRSRRTAPPPPVLPYPGYPGYPGYPE